MESKNVTFRIKSSTWKDYSIKLEKDKGEIVLKNINLGFNINHSSVANKLLEKYLENKIDIEPPTKAIGEGLAIKGVFLNPKLWLETRKVIAENQANGNKINGGLGGLLTKLIECYNRKGIFLFTL